MNELVALFSQPAIWLALVTLIVMEVVLGIDNLIFIYTAMAFSAGVEMLNIFARRRQARRAGAERTAGKTA